MMCRAFINHALQKLLLVFSTTGSAANLPGPRGHGERRKHRGQGSEVATRQRLDKQVSLLVPR